MIWTVLEIPATVNTAGQRGGHIISRRKNAEKKKREREIERIHLTPEIFLKKKAFVFEFAPPLSLSLSLSTSSLQMGFNWCCWLSKVPYMESSVFPSCREKKHKKVKLYNHK